MRPPCEVVVNTVLPNVRAELVKVLIREYHMRQVDVASMLGITQASVSQYCSAIRGKDKVLIEIFPEIEKYAQETARKLMEKDTSVKDPESWIHLCDICKRIFYNPKFKQYRQEIYKIKECGICDER
jgi:predicted transcriptional regulator